ncbi:MAG: GNAT family protein [Pseudomonadota bacterium]
MLKGPLCTLRHITAADLDTYIALLNEPSTRGDYWGAQFQSPDMISKEFAQTGFATEERETLLIVDLQDQMVGMIFHFKGRTAICREIGYRILRPELGGRGYMSHAVAMLCEHLFLAYQYNRLDIYMDVENIASERIAQKCGFSYEGTMRGAFLVNGRLRDSKVYSRLRCEWAARRPA